MHIIQDHNKYTCTCRLTNTCSCGCVDILSPQTPPLSITIVSFTVEPGSSLTAREDISGYFVEFQLLDYDYGELETPSVLTSPHSTLPVVFNFKKGAVLLHGAKLTAHESTLICSYIVHVGGARQYKLGIHKLHVHDVHTGEMYMYVYPVHIQGYMYMYNMVCL